MSPISLEKITEEDILLIEKWLCKDYIKKWYNPIEEWIYEIKNRNGEYNFIRHLIVKHNFTKIGFCQYYDCYDAQEDWYKIDRPNCTYSIDYLIGEENFLSKGYGKEVVCQLIEKVKFENGKEILVQPDIENEPSKKILLANGFIYNDEEKFFYKKI